MTGAISLIPHDVGLRQVELGLLRRNPKFGILHHLAVFDPADVLFVSVAAHEHDNSAPRRSIFEVGRPPCGAGLSALPKPRRRVFALAGFHP